MHLELLQYLCQYLCPGVDNNLDFISLGEIWYSMVFYGIILDLYCSAITSILHFERGIMSYVSWLPARKRCIDAQAIMAALSAEWRSVLETVRRNKQPVQR